MTELVSAVLCAVVVTALALVFGRFCQSVLQRDGRSNQSPPSRTERAQGQDRRFPDSSP